MRGDSLVTHSGRTKVGKCLHLNCTSANVKKTARSTQTQARHDFHLFITFILDSQLDRQWVTFCVCVCLCVCVWCACVYAICTCGVVNVLYWRGSPLDSHLYTHMALMSSGYAHSTTHSAKVHSLLYANLSASICMQYARGYVRCDRTASVLYCSCVVSQTRFGRSEFSFVSGFYFDSMSKLQMHCIPNNIHCHIFVCLISK